MLRPDDPSVVGRFASVAAGPVASGFTSGRFSRHRRDRESVSKHDTVRVRAAGSRRHMDTGNSALFARPADQWVPTGENLGHQLQVVDSKRLKSRAHLISHPAKRFSTLRLHDVRPSLSMFEMGLALM